VGHYPPPAPDMGILPEPCHVNDTPERVLSTCGQSIVDKSQLHSKPLNERNGLFVSLVVTINISA